MRKLFLFLMCLLISGNCFAAFSRVTGQDALGTGSSTTASATYPGATTSGHFLKSSLYINNNAVVTMTGWTAGCNNKFTAGDQILSFYKISDGTETAPSATWTGSAAWKMHIYEYQGNSNPILTDGSNTSSTTAVNTLTTGSITTTNANDLIFANWGFNNTVTLPVINTAGFNLRQQDASIRLFDADGVVSSTGTYNINASWTTNRQIGSCIEAFQAANTTTASTGINLSNVNKSNVNL